MVSVSTANKPAWGQLQTLLLAAFVVMLYFGTTAATYMAFTSQFPGHNDFLSRWEPARGYWLDGINPYSDEATRNIQQLIYGRPVEPGEDPGLFAYPFYTIFVVWPFVYVPYSWASAGWMVLLEGCLIVAALLTLDLLKWRPKPWLLAIFLVWTLLFYPAMRGLFLGQPGLLVYGLQIYAVWALVKGHERAAGVALALSTLKPQMGYLIVPLLLLWGLRTQRWQFIFGFTVSFGVLMGASFALLPSWLGEWIDQVRQYPGYTEIGSPLWVLAHLTELRVDPMSGEWIVQGQIGYFVEFILTTTMYAYLLWTWFVLLVQNRHERWLWTTALTLVITHLVAPRTATPHFVLFLLPLTFAFKYMTDRNRQRSGLWILMALIGLFVLPWAHFLLTVEGEFEHPTVYLPLPLMCFGLTVLTRRLWWQKTPMPRNLSLPDGAR